MPTPRISASSYSNTAPLIWSFLYGSERGKYELILDNAPARSAELLANKRVDAALVPVIEYQRIDEVLLIEDVCVGARENVRSVCLVTKGADLRDVKRVALDVSSKTSVALTKIIFREFFGFEPIYKEAKPNLDEMLETADCALLIGDPALLIAESKTNYQLPITNYHFRKFDLAETWHKFTGFGFVFAMWMANARIKRLPERLILPPRATKAWRISKKSSQITKRKSLLPEKISVFIYPKIFLIRLMKICAKACVYFSNWRIKIV